MTLQQLEYFRILAKYEHFTRAADALSISQPSLSYAIGQLETELGVLLFDRKGRTIELNSYGRIFLTYVESALLTLEQGHENIRLLTKTVNQSIRVGYIYSLTNILLTDIIKEFYAKSNNEKTAFDFKNNSNDLLIDNLENGFLDLVLCVVPPKNNNYIKIFEQELFLFVPSFHEFAKKNEISIQDLNDVDFINYRSNTGLRIVTDNIFKANGVSPNVKLEVDECNAALSLMYLNEGMTIMPIVPGIDYEKVATVKIKGIEAIREVYLAWNDSINTNQQIKDFRDFIINLYDKKSF